MQRNAVKSLDEAPKPLGAEPKPLGAEPKPLGAEPEPGAPALARRPTRMAVNVPTDLLRSFVAIVEAGSMAQATNTILLSQSALSLQIKRLEDLLQQRLFHRIGRSLMLTAAGEELVGLARQLLALNDRIMASLGADPEPEPLLLGVVQDFADTGLPQVLAAFGRLHKRIRLQLRVAGSAELLSLFDRAQLDVLVCLGRHGELRRGTSLPLAELPMAWIGDATLAHAPELPLVLLEPPCTFRTALLEALDRAERRYRIVLETPSLPGLRAAVRAGLGLTCRTAEYAESAGLPLARAAELPALSRIDYMLLSRDPATEAARDLVLLLRGVLGDEPDES